jgi:hypothetical protein
VSCITRSQNPNYGRVDSSDLQNLLDLDYPLDEEHISALNMGSGWRKHQVPSSPRNYRADEGPTYNCGTFLPIRSVNITERTLDGKSFY